MTKQDFEQTLLLYHQENLVATAQGFQKLLSIHPNDTVAQIYLERVKLLRSNLNLWILKMKLVLYESSEGLE